MASIIPPMLEFAQGAYQGGRAAYIGYRALQFLKNKKKQKKKRYN